jgi:anti-sigma B factor antagonist
VATTSCDLPGRDDPDGLIRLNHVILPDGAVVIAISGDLDLATADRTVRYVSEIIDQHEGPISADLSSLRFCDACGLGALIRVATYAERQGRWVELAQPSEALVRIMRLTGVDARLLVPAPAG